MSLSSTLSSALSGLTAAARGAEVVSANVANATTEGYGQRELTLATQSVGHVGAGVRVVGVERQVDLALLSDRRIAEASHAGVAVEGEFLSRLETAYGTPDQANSLSGLIAGFERALIEAASRPDSEARLSNVAETARQMVAKINAVGRTIQQARGEADAAIAGQVAELNTTLAQIAELNGQIRAYSGGNRDASALIDQRQQLIDRIAAAVPLREVSRDHGQIALYTTGGAILLDGRPAELGFTPSNMITPDMAVGGALSGLTINGNPVTTSGATGPIAGGALAANFALRDALAPTAQTRLDALARDLVERMADPAVDPTLTPGDPGLFTDAGAAFLAADEVGLAQRLRLNALADPVAGGALWRLRDGLGATAQGPVGNAAGLNRLADALSAGRTPVSGGFTGGDRSFSTFAGDVLSLAGAERQAADARASYLGAQYTSLRGLELQSGVDTDAEMQNLLLVEQAYAANAKVVQAVDDMIQTLLGI